MDYDQILRRNTRSQRYLNAQESIKRKDEQLTTLFLKEIKNILETDEELVKLLLVRYAKSCDKYHEITILSPYGEEGKLYDITDFDIFDIICDSMLGDSKIPKGVLINALMNAKYIYTSEIIITKGIFKDWRVRCRSDNFKKTVFTITISKSDIDNLFLTFKQKIIEESNKNIILDEAFSTAFRMIFLNLGENRGFKDFMQFYLENYPKSYEEYCTNNTPSEIKNLDLIRQSVIEYYNSIIVSE